MKSLFSLLLLTALNVFATESDSFFTQHGYLGIPDDQRYPDSPHQPIAAVSARHYYAISRVETTDASGFRKAQRFGKPLYVAKRNGFVYYATELRGDFAQPRGVREWVTVLNRYRYNP